MSFTLKTTQRDIDLLFDMVRNSDYVAGNVDYSKKAQNTMIKLDEDNTSINAYAQTFNENSHGITMFNGLCNAIRMSSICVAHFKEFGKDETNKGVPRLALAMRWLGNQIIDKGYTFTISDITKGIQELCYEDEIGGIVGIESNAYTAGGILSVIGHEQGHICLSHTVREDWTNEVSRNDERQADLFGCNVGITTPFSTHVVLGTLFVEIVFNWMSGNQDFVTTHPASRERVYNTINAHDTVLRELGITKENIEWLLPPLGETDDEYTPESDTEDDIHRKLLSMVG